MRAAERTHTTVVCQHSIKMRERDTDRLEGQHAGCVLEERGPLGGTVLRERQRVGLRGRRLSTNEWQPMRFILRICVFARTPHICTYDACDMRPRWGVRADKLAKSGNVPTPSVFRCRFFDVPSIWLCWA